MAGLSEGGSTVVWIKYESTYYPWGVTPKEKKMYYHISSCNLSDSMDESAAAGAESAASSSAAMSLSSRGISGVELSPPLLARLLTQTQRNQHLWQPISLWSQITTSSPFMTHWHWSCPRFLIMDCHAYISRIHAIIWFIMSVNRSVPRTVYSNLIFLTWIIFCI